MRRCHEMGLARVADASRPGPTVTCTLSGGGTSSQVASGRAPPGSTVTILKNGTSAGTATADGTGAWSLALTGLANGDIIAASTPRTSSTATASVAP